MIVLPGRKVIVSMANVSLPRMATTMPRELTPITGTLSITYDPVALVTANNYLQ